MGSEEVQVFCYGADHLHYIGGKVKKKPRLVVHSEDEQLKIIKTIHEAAHLGRDKILSQLDRYTTDQRCTSKYVHT